MPVAYESDGGTVFAASASNAAITVPLPATRPVGSVMYLIAWSRLITDTPQVTLGWALIAGFPVSSGTASGGRIWVYAKIVTGSESAPTFNTTTAVTGNSGDLWGACIVCYSGIYLGGGAAGSQAQIDGMLDGTPTVTDASGTTACTYPALTIAEDNSMVVRFLARFRDAVDTFTPTATWTEREDAGSTVRTGGQFHLQDKLATASGSQASVTVAPSVTTASRYLAVSLALKSALRPVIADTLALADSVTPQLLGPPVAYATAVMADSPAAYYRLGESSGQPQDSSGNGNHTTATTGTPTYAQAGAIADGNTAISLPGTAGNGFSAPDSGTLDLGDVFTLETWIKLNATGQLHVIISKGGNAYQLDITSAGVVEVAQADVGTIAASTTTITDTTTWHHVVATKNGATVKLYIDGVDVTGTVTNRTCVNTATAFYIGTYYSGGFFPTNALLDEVALYPTALSASRVAAHYAAASFVPPGPEQEIDDTLALSDSATTQAVFQRTVPDTLAVADAQAFARAVTLADSLALADSALPAAVTAHTRPVADTLTLADAVTTALVKTATISDTLTLADLLSSAAVFQRSVLDTLTALDAAPSFVRTITLPLADTLALADSASASKAAAQAVDDTLSLADLATTAAGKGVSLADTLLLADALSSSAALQRTLADTLALTDSQAFARGLTLAETLSVADALASTAVLQRVIADTLTLADVLSAGQGRALGIADTLLLADFCDPVKTSGSIGLTQDIPDTLAVADSFSRVAAFGRPQDDTLAVADATATSAAFSFALADLLTLSDIAAPSGSGAKALADTLTLSDSAATVSVAQRTVADTLTLADLTDRSRGQVKALADSLTLADATTRTASKGALIEDVLALADALSFQRTSVLELAEALALTDALSLDRLLVLAELVALADMQLVKLRGPGTVLNLADAIYLGETPADRVYAGEVQVWP